MMQITEVRVKDFPVFNEEGESWDPSSNPDVAFAVFTAANELVASTEAIPNARVDTTLTFSSSSTFPITLDFPTLQYNLVIVDVDESSSNNAIIDQVKITPYKKGADFPDPIFFNGDRNTAFKLGVYYNTSGSGSL
jgi:hypothetical protein